MSIKEAAARSPLRKYTDELNDLPVDVLLGRIVLFTISDEPVSRDDLVAWFDELGLDKAYLPTPNKRSDAFRKATSDTKNSYPLSKGRTAQLLCRDVATTGEIVHRQITREIRDGSNRRLSYTAAIDCRFYRATSSDQDTARMKTAVNINNLEPDEVSQVRSVAQEIYQRYLHYYDFMDGPKLRAIVRSYLRKLNAIEIKGGVYFVHARRDPELKPLTELVSRFGGKCYMHTIPIVDLESEREFIAHAFEREASESLQEITRDVRAMISSGRAVTPAAYAKMMERYQEVMGNAEEYLTTLEISQDLTAAAAEIAVKALGEAREAMLK